ncbi:(2Fe-2S) ferredoxin domain-containing protein [Methylosinus sp. Sm6]|uniref:(2Fe-2S) ferredoxin domain-containing protein n=1 Tax=Methylosinus sp. Sm6 TaxID=2866948 RepID=UPI001C992A7B|nr:(2Fe-2S) ferredoxin domain-containing protein [Methylosinus sp. Sm6]MBY6243123.1 (2Fe-2S) ferredoxin domain-containing protein [Methylosinus sp. Sm6]
MNASVAPPLVRLLVCLGPRCDAQGGGESLLAELRAALAEAFAEDLARGRIALATRDCLRHCTREPVARVEPSGDVFSNPRIDELLAAVARELAM